MSEKAGVHHAAGGAAAAWPIAARAQHASDIARIGVLNTGLDDAVSGGLGYRAFVAELQKLGFAEGRNLAIDYGRTDQGPDKAFADATAMVRSNVAVIVASGSELPLQAAVAASASIPVVMLANEFDPITRGYVASLARPGGNITGLFYRQPELAQKRVELLAEAFPARSAFGRSLGCNLVGNSRGSRADGKDTEPAGSFGET